MFDDITTFFLKKIEAFVCSPMFILWIHILFASSWILKMCFVYLPSLNNSILCVLGTLSLIVMEVL
jgi:hypothetical protein